jgi:hypothetical protein
VAGRRGQFVIMMTDDRFALVDQGIGDLTHAPAVAEQHIAARLGASGSSTGAVREGTELLDEAIAAWNALLKHYSK